MSSKKQNNTSIYTFIVIIVIVLVLMGLMIFFVLGGKNSPTSPSSSLSNKSFDSKPVSQSIMSKLSSVSLSAISGSLTTAPKSNISHINNTLLTKNSLPRVVYIGADYCPFCAAERWALIIALSKFGTFSNLHYMTSSSSDVYPNTATFTFYNATYKSSYVTFTPVETTTNIPSASGSYTPLQNMTQLEAKLFSKYDAPPYVTQSSSGSIPFVDMANKYLLVGAQYVPAVLQNKNWSQIISSVYLYNSKISNNILSSAGYLIKDICSITNEKPQNVCSQI